MVRGSNCESLNPTCGSDRLAILSPNDGRVVDISCKT